LFVWVGLVLKNQFDAALLVLIFKKYFVKFRSTYFISVEFIWKNSANSSLWNWFKWWFRWLAIDFVCPQLAITNVWQIPHILLRFHLWQFTYQFWFDLLIAWVVCICLNIVISIWKRSCWFRLDTTVILWIAEATICVDFNWLWKWFHYCSVIQYDSVYPN